MLLVAELPHKFGSAIHIRYDLKVKNGSVFAERNDELITVMMSELAVHSVFKPPNERFTLTAPVNRNIPYIVIGNNHSTSRGLKSITNNAKLPKSNSYFIFTDESISNMCEK